jgi:transposase
MYSLLEEQRSVIKFLVAEQKVKSPATSFRGLKKILSRATFDNWVSQFREGGTSVCYRPRTGRPARAVTTTIVANVKAFVNKNRRVILEEVAIKFSIGKAWHTRFYTNT